MKTSHSSDNQPTAENVQAAGRGSPLPRIVVDLRKGWTPFADEISGIMGNAASELLRLQATEDAFALAMAKHVSITEWATIIGYVRRLQADPQEWIALGQTPPEYLHNVPSAGDPDAVTNNQ